MENPAHLFQAGASVTVSFTYAPAWAQEMQPESPARTYAFTFECLWGTENPMAALATATTKMLETYTWAKQYTTDPISTLEMLTSLEALPILAECGLACTES